VISTLADMDRWLEAWRGGELLSDSLAAEMWDLVAVEGAPGFGYGLGAAGLGDYRGHNGSVPGYESAVWEIAGHRIVVFTNGFCHPVELEVHTADAIAFAIGEHLLP
jgi:D-alanyl-D-alanine carboxypeptidase